MEGKGQGHILLSPQVDALLLEQECEHICLLVFGSHHLESHTDALPEGVLEQQVVRQQVIQLPMDHLRLVFQRQDTHALGLETPVAHLLTLEHQVRHLHFIQLTRGVDYIDQSFTIGRYLYLGRRQCEVLLVAARP